MTRLFIILSILLGMIACSPAASNLSDDDATKKKEATPKKIIDGRWHTDFGLLELTEAKDGKVEGKYLGEFLRGSLKGTLDRKTRILKGTATFRNPPASKQQHLSGTDANSWKRRYNNFWEGLPKQMKEKSGHFYKLKNATLCEIEIKFDENYSVIFNAVSRIRTCKGADGNRHWIAFRLEGHIYLYADGVSGEQLEKAFPEDTVSNRTTYPRLHERYLGALDKYYRHKNQYNDTTHRSLAKKQKTNDYLPIYSLHGSYWYKKRSGAPGFDGPLK